MGEKRIATVSAAVEFIEGHLTEKLDLDCVAAAVHYSKYYLHRVFNSTVGMTIHDYVQRRQLTEAAKLLVFSAKPIIEVAAAAGYESQQAFSNIFKAMYKHTPNQYRKNEKFYPLQLKFRMEGDYEMLYGNEVQEWSIEFAGEEDISCWMELVRLVIDGFPHLYEEEYTEELVRRIKRKQALILKDGSIAVGIMLFSHETGSIDFMGTHPLYRSKGIPKAFLDKVMNELVHGNEISVTTFREGDKADTGQRREIQGLGFSEAELLVEFGYPTQRFILSKEDVNDE